MRQDLRFAIRTFLRTPVFTLTAILTLAIGIGANAAMFSVIRAVFLRPLGFPADQRLVFLWQTNTERGIAKDRVSPANFVDWRAQSQLLDETGFVTAWGGSRSFLLVGPDGTERVRCAYASAGYLRAFGVNPALGRSFSPEEDHSKGNRPVILSWSFWRDRFGGAADIIGKTLEIDGYDSGTYSIVGVMPPGFDFPGKTQIWLPAAFMGVRFPKPDEPDRCCPWLEVVARLKPGVELPQLRAELNAIARRVAERHPQSSNPSGVEVTPLREQLVGSYRLGLYALFGAAGCILLIACANVANLLLSRGVTRHAEMATRLALGATRGRIVRQLLVESLVLAAAGAVLGTLLAFGVRNLLVQGFGDRIPLLEGARVDLPVLAFTALVMMASAVLCGLAPASQWRHAGWQTRQTTQNPRQQRLRRALVVSEIALAMMLVAGAGLLLRTLLALQRVDPGFRPQRVLAVSLDLTARAFRGPGNQQPYFQDLMARVAALPGVRLVGGVNQLPLVERAGPGQAFTLEGEPLRTIDESPRVTLRGVTPDFFPTMGIPLKAGRLFTEQDSWNGKMVAIVNESAARRYWPGQDPLGKRFFQGSRERLGYVRRPGRPDEPEWREIVGVVGDVRESGLDAEPHPEMYYCYRQYPWYTATLLVLTDGDPLALAGAVRHEVKRVNPNSVISRVRTMEDVVAQSIAQPADRARLIGVFSLAALLLAMLGIYGVMSYTVAQRTREIGIRMALGAQKGDVTRMLLGNALRLTLVGIVLGLLGALLAGRWVATLLYRVSPADPFTMAAACLLLASAALAASYLPARRAMRVDPAVALREE